MLTNISLVLEACQQLNITYEILTPNQNLIRVQHCGQDYYFVNYTTPFNSAPTVEIFKDKEYTYQLLKGKIRTPQTVGFLSPFCDEKYRQYLTLQDCTQIAIEVTKIFPIPVIIKKNRGSAGNNVFLCETPEQIQTAIETVFNVNSKDYDYVCLAQEYIDIRHEYRAVFFNKKLVLLYEKDKSGAKFMGNLSPLHWEGAKAKHIKDSQIISEVESFVDGDLLPNRICQYLFELSQKFNQFFEQCPVLKAEEPLRSSRLVLCDLTARTLKLGLGLLGIQVLERM